MTDNPNPPRIQTTELWDGYAYVNGRIHGSKWRKAWEVVVQFDSEEEALAFMEKLIPRPHAGLVEAVKDLIDACLDTMATHVEAAHLESAVDKVCAILKELDR